MVLRISIYRGCGACSQARLDARSSSRANLLTSSGSYPFRNVFFLGRVGASRCLPTRREVQIAAVLGGGPRHWPAVLYTLRLVVELARR